MEFVSPTLMERGDQGLTRQLHYMGLSSTGWNIGAAAEASEAVVWFPDPSLKLSVLGFKEGPGNDYCTTFHSSSCITKCCNTHFYATCMVELSTIFTFRSNMYVRSPVPIPPPRDRRIMIWASLSEPHSIVATDEISVCLYIYIYGGQLSVYLVIPSEARF